MSSKKKFGSANELNRTDFSKLSCFSHCSQSSSSSRRRRFTHELLSKLPSSLRGSQISTFSNESSPFPQTDPITFYIQHKNNSLSEEMPSAMRNQRRSPREDDKKTGRSDISYNQSTKSAEPKNRKPANKTTSDQGQSDLPPIKEETKDEYDHELYHTSPRVFKPRLYNFKNPLYNLNNFEKNSFKVLAPPFWVLIDHMIAVVWFLYSGDKREKVDVVHLQWALEFAKWLRDERGDHSKIIRTLIGVFQDAIAEKKGKEDEDDREATNDYESYEDAHAAHSKEDEMTSVTLQDILARTSGLPPEKVYVPFPYGGPVYETGPKDYPIPPPDSPPQHERLKNIEDEDGDHGRLLKFLQQMRETQKDKVNKESKRLQELDEAIEALKEGKLKFGEWLKEHFK